MMVVFTLGGVRYQALNGAQLDFNDTLSIAVTTRDQAETDRLWAALTEGGAALQCGWCRDRFGVAWQVVPEALPRLLGGPDPQGAGRAMQAMLKMQKIDIAALERAYAGG
jgi:predicted 3-demethylubiquinone-9 3-methyltransferase (glyoxalase superfamily)